MAAWTLDCDRGVGAYFDEALFVDVHGLFAVHLLRLLECELVPQTVFVDAVVERSDGLLPGLGQRLLRAIA